MRRTAHLLLILLILPGVVLPGPIAICACAAISCVDCEGCCKPPAAPKSCCAGHAAVRSEQSRDARPTVGAKKSCLGCFDLAPEKHETPRPETQGHDLPDFAHIAFGGVVALAPPSVVVAPTARPTSHAPPGDIRTLPLLI